MTDEYVPAEQRSQYDLPSADEYVPAGHSVQLEEPFDEYDPARQFWQTLEDVAPTADEYVPAEQSEQPD